MNSLLSFRKAARSQTYSRVWEAFSRFARQVRYFSESPKSYTILRISPGGVKQEAALGEPLAMQMLAILHLSPSSVGDAVFS